MHTRDSENELHTKNICVHTSLSEVKFIKNYLKIVRSWMVSDLRFVSAT